jgi:hypothetical protein
MKLNFTIDERGILTTLICRGSEASYATKQKGHLRTASRLQQFRTLARRNEPKMAKWESNAEKTLCIFDGTSVGGHC